VIHAIACIQLHVCVLVVVPVWPLLCLRLLLYHGASYVCVRQDFCGTVLSLISVTLNCALEY